MCHFCWESKQVFSDVVWISFIHLPILKLCILLNFIHHIHYLIHHTHRFGSHKLKLSGRQGVIFIFPEQKLTTTAAVRDLLSVWTTSEATRAAPECRTLGTVSRARACSPLLLQLQSLRPSRFQKVRHGNDLKNTQQFQFIGKTEEKSLL